MFDLANPKLYNPTVALVLVTIPFVC